MGPPGLARLLLRITVRDLDVRAALLGDLKRSACAKSGGQGHVLGWLVCKEYEPGSDLYVVYTAGLRFSRLSDRTFIAKFTRLFRY